MMKRKAAFCLAVLLVLTLSGSAWAEGFFTYWQSPQQISDSGKQPEEERSPGAALFLDAYFSNLQVDGWSLYETYAPLGAVVGENNTTSPETLRYRQKETVITEGKWTSLLDNGTLRKQVQEWIESQLAWVAEDQVVFAGKRRVHGNSDSFSRHVRRNPGLAKRFGDTGQLFASAGRWRRNGL